MEGHLYFAGGPNGPLINRAQCKDGNKTEIR